ncbi:hypothetical protein [Pedobacter sp. GR22-10]|uniref:hypothetical protein n=1 Tax=Pedobacter sp. GR22-10 TaxID=2994472 RepID=UPI00224595B8|nr:hypothetical protein [Pedobacter sp. GR22-10]MCX2429876.1 hypothetical protein [Pedobacter sp. GR22-10]
MSIQIIEKTVFLAVARKMFEASIAVKVNENFYPCCREMSSERIIDIVASWHTLNWDSFENEYSEGEQMPEREELLIGITPPPPTAVQFLKWLHCIRYNINHNCIPRQNTTDLQDILFLDRLIRDVSKAIIEQLPDYRAALWSTYNLNHL